MRYMAAAAAALHKIRDVLQVYDISKCVARTWLIDNKGFKSLEDFGVMDGETDVLEMEKCLAIRSVTTCVGG